MRVVGNEFDAEDVAQNVFLEIFQNGKQSEVADQPALIRTMATRRALDQLRRRKMNEELNGNESSVSEHEPSAYVIASELEQRLQMGLVQLPRRESEVFCLIYFEGLSISDTSRILRISSGAVSKSLSVARSRLSTIFGYYPSKAKP